MERGQSLQVSWASQVSPGGQAVLKVLGVDGRRHVGFVLVFVLGDVAEARHLRQPQLLHQPEELAGGILQQQVGGLHLLDLAIRDHLPGGEKLGEIMCVW